MSYRRDINWKCLTDNLINTGDSAQMLDGKEEKGFNFRLAAPPLIPFYFPSSVIANFDRDFLFKGARQPRAQRGND